MALSATFTANFSSFYDAVAKADVKLKDFGAGADKVGGRLNRMADSFSGVKVIQEAQLMVKAIGDIENISKLTDKELARVGATAAEAVEKLNRLGKDVPQDLQAIADKTKGANAATTDWLGTITKIAGAVGIAFSVDAIVGFIGSVFSAASAVKDLSDQWGVSTTAVQQWTGAAKASGVEAATVGKSVQFLSQKLAEGSKEYDALLKNVGLSGEALRKMPLEEAYKQVLGVIGNITDENLQLDISLGLLGDSSKKMIGAVRDGFLEAADAQKIMSEETIKRLEAAQAQWEKFVNAVKTYTGEMLIGIQSTVQGMTSSWGNFFGYMALAFRDLGNTQAAEAFLQAREHSANYTKSLQTTTAAIKGVTAPTDAMNRLLRNTAVVLADVKGGEEAATAAQRARADSLREATREQDAYNKSIEDYKDSTADLAGKFAGDEAIAKAIQYQQALEQSIPIQQMTRATQDDINKVMMAAIDVYERAGQTAPLDMWKIAIATEKVETAVEGVRRGVNELQRDWPKALDLPMPKLDTLGAAPKPGMFDGFAKSLTGALSKSVISAIQGGGNIFAAAGSTIGSYILDPKLSGVGKAIGNAAAKLPGLLGSAISSAIPVVGSFIGPAIGWLSNKISGWFGKKEHEKLRESFIEAAGGIEPLRAAADAAGVSLDNLMRARKTDSVKAAISEIEASLKFQADAYAVAIETAEKYGFTIEQLGPAMARQELDKKAQELFKDWQVLNAAGIDTVAITEKMAEGVNDYVQDALKMGAEIPAAMRPMLESFAKSGLLLDEAGGQITDLEGHGLSFTMTMSEGFKELIGEVKLLAEAITRSLGGAIEKVPKEISVDGTINWKGKGSYRPPELEGYAGGTKGFKNFGTGTPVMLHGWEAVVPRDDASAVVHSAGSSPVAAAVAPVININAQGAFFDTPGDLQRLADKVNDALTAKFGLRNAMRAG